MENMKTIEQTVAEQATGCGEHKRGIGQLYAGPINRKGYVTDPGTPLEREAAQDWLEQGGEVAVPNAGAGSYRKVFAKLGFDTVSVFDWTSSAGDWSFAVFDGCSWHPAFQCNRYPRAGFTYSVDRELGFESKDDCFKYMAS